MSVINLDEIEARAKAATAGPWTVCPMDMYIFGGDGHMVASNCPGEDGWQVRGFGAEKAGQRPEGSQDANAAFIASAREDIPKLIAEVRRLQGLECKCWGALEVKLDQAELHATSTIPAKTEALQTHASMIAAGTVYPDCLCALCCCPSGRRHLWGRHEDSEPLPPIACARCGMERHTALVVAGVVFPDCKCELCMQSARTRAQL